MTAQAQLAKCVGTGCERREGCVRFRSLASGQNVFDPPPLKRVSQACAYFHPIGAMPQALMLTVEEAEEWATNPVPQNRREKTR